MTDRNKRAQRPKEILPETRQRESEHHENLILLEVPNRLPPERFCFLARFRRCDGTEGRMIRLLEAAFMRLVVHIPRTMLHRVCIPSLPLQCLFWIHSAKAIDESLHQLTSECFGANGFP